MEIISNDEILNSLQEELSKDFDFLSKIGTGATGEVFLVRRVGEQKEYALKLLSKPKDVDYAAEQRFEQEAKIAQTLSHKNLIRIEDFRKLRDNIFYMLMEYLEGGSLADMLDQKQPFAFTEILSLTHQLCCGLNCAHSSGVIHRDLKPDNILFDASGVLKIADFGLAKLIDSELNLTKTGDTVGTPNYMAPEQFRGEDANEQTDIYALGLIMFEMLTGQRAFSNDNYLALAAMHLNHPLPDISPLREEVPKWLKEIITICCEKKAKYRYSSVAELAQDLEPKMKRLGIEVDEVLSPETNASFSQLVKRFFK